MVVVFGDPLEAQVRSASEKFRVVYSAIGSSQSPLWIAHEGGLFQKHGLDVELLYVAGGSRAAQVILSGEVPVAMFNGGSVISADLPGRTSLMLPAG
jgi:NitT/TauT family transport system substrate-binding protein